MIGIGPGVGVSRPRGLDRAIMALFAAGEKGVFYDFSDLSTMFQDSAGTVAAAIEQPVGKILDKSGNGNHATQATSTARPILRQDASGHYYLDFDGVDDFLVTSAIDFAGTDKVSVFAGLHKLSDAVQGIVCETGATGTTNYVWSLQAPSGTTGTNKFLFGSRGTSASNATLLSTGGLYDAPVTSVITGIGDIAGDLSRIRANGGVTIVDSTLNQGSGNYANLPIHIGMRDGTSYPFNGHIYQLIVRGALSDAAQIAAAESYVNSKTGAY